MTPLVRRYIPTALRAAAEIALSLAAPSASAGSLPWADSAKWSGPALFVVNMWWRVRMPPRGAAAGR